MASSHATPLIALLTDFGTADGYVGVMKAVILGIVPDVPLVDLSHEIPPQDVRQAAWILHTLWPYLPQWAICLAVVDPGVGTARRPIAFTVRGLTFVGPDNGLFSYVLAAREPEQIVTLTNPAYHLPHPSATFHGRDLFAPVAAYLARGVPLSELGPQMPGASLVRFDLPQPADHPHGLLGHVVHVDRFGNLITDFGPGLAAQILGDAHVRLRIGPTQVTDRATTFAAGPAEEPFMLIDSSGHLAIAVRNGSAAGCLGAVLGTEVLALGVSHPKGPEP
jgi:S-adenosylmethionine hydrolase